MINTYSLSGFKESLTKEAGIGAAVKAVKGAASAAKKTVKTFAGNAKKGYKNTGKRGRPGQTAGHRTGRFVAENKKELAIGAGAATATVGTGAAAVALSRDKKASVAASIIAQSI